MRLADDVLVDVDGGCSLLSTLLTRNAWKTMMSRCNAASKRQPERIAECYHEFLRRFLAFREGTEAQHDSGCLRRACPSKSKRRKHEAPTSSASDGAVAATLTLGETLRGVRKDSSAEMLEVVIRRIAGAESHLASPTASDARDKHHKHPYAQSW